MPIDGEQPLVIETAPPFAPDRLALLDDVSQMRPLDELEAEIIRFAIAHYRGQMSEVARRLRIGRSTLYRKLEALQLSDDDPQNDRRPRGGRVTIAPITHSGMAILPQYNCVASKNSRLLRRLPL